MEIRGGLIAASSSRSISAMACSFSASGQHWIACRPGFFLSVRVLSRLFRRLLLERLTAAYCAGRLEFFADQAALAEPAAFNACVATLRKTECQRSTTMSPWGRLLVAVRIGRPVVGADRADEGQHRGRKPPAGGRDH